jgi:hypothetical protein
MKAIPAILVVSLLLIVPNLSYAAEEPADAQLIPGEKQMLDFYRTQSRWSDPGDFAGLYDGLPDDIPGIVQCVQGALIHGGLLWLYKLEPSEAQAEGSQIRETKELLRRIKRLEDKPLLAPRPMEKRMVVNCRQFAVLTCSILRHKGIPARARAGYALYTWGRGKYENHWICEYWNANERRWVQVDAQIDDPQRKLMRIDFNTLDMPKGKYVTAGEGWRLYRGGKVPVENFGLGMKDGWAAIGWDMVMHNVICDTMALNKDEFLPWDFNPYWEKKQEEISADDMAVIDKAAALAADLENRWGEMREFYESRPNLHMPEGYRKKWD